MNLADLLADLPGILAVQGPTDCLISRIVADSRQAGPGALFVAYRGVEVDGHRFLADAVLRGAAALVGELTPPADCPVPYVQVEDGRAALAWLVSAWYGHPSRSMALVGITGTDGKTTTANLLFSILRTAGKHVGLISTVNAIIGDQVYDTGLHTTTPDAPDVQRLLAQMRDAGTEIAVLEATSHGLAQHRVTGCAFDVAVVTNITHEHLDFHGSYEAYRGAKALLFRALTDSRLGAARKPGISSLPKTAVLNRDDSSFAFLASIPAERVITYGVAEEMRRGGGADTELGRGCGGVRQVIHLTAHDIRHSPSGTQFDLQVSVAFASVPPGFRVPASPCPLFTPLVGAFNVYNVLAAAAAALTLGIEPEAIRAGAAAMKGVPGRMERVDRGQPFIAIVDFAHTPNALARALETARGLVG
ncbi:MAG: UDP-N-acetylmuramoyl-L-alanyl-D-glutamate--2,6-diaminopimelate ligase, partial [Anaerolineae bacterium]|nr:UDP-N-acetylmuramoyl-L-alanyl-D-glutamate--2,6-diaminopimelate ligase [Anaerolineae bacterium]